MYYCLVSQSDCEPRLRLSEQVFFFSCASNTRLLLKREKVVVYLNKQYATNDDNCFPLKQAKVISMILFYGT